MFSTRAAAERAALEGEGDDLDTQQCLLIQQELLSVGICALLTRISALTTYPVIRAVRRGPRTRQASRRVFRSTSTTESSQRHGLRMPSANVKIPTSADQSLRIQNPPMKTKSPRILVATARNKRMLRSMERRRHRSISACSCAIVKEDYGHMIKTDRLF